MDLNYMIYYIIPIINKIEKSINSAKTIKRAYLFLEESDAKEFKVYLESLSNKPTCQLNKKVYEDWNLEWKIDHQWSSQN